jgi:tetratricopeptide (TPR) repeat protein
VGSNFVVEMRNALKISARMIAVLSPAYLASPYTLAEWTDVFRRDPTGEKRLLLPVKVAPCEAEPLLGTLLWINLVERDEQQAQRLLIQGVQGSPRTLATVAFPAAPATWNIPYLRNPHFTGREALLEQLARQLAPQTDDIAGSTRRTALTQPQAIKGLGGIGKTQIAVEYAYRSREQRQYQHILWVDASSQQALVASFGDKRLLPGFAARNETNQRRLVAALKRWLEECQQPWLLVFDNADEVTLVQEYLPEQGRGSVLLTTRAAAVGALATSVVVDTLGFVEGTQLLLRRAQRFEQASDAEVNEAGNIVVLLDHFPLALDQAGAYIEETQCRFADYLTIYQNHRDMLLARRGRQVLRYPDSVATTWSLSFAKVQQANPAAAELLRLCAFLAPERIPEELIMERAACWPALLKAAATDPLTFRQMIEELLKYSLVKPLVEEHALSIHRLVQAALINTLKPAVQRRWAARVLLALDEIFLDANDVAAWPRYQRYLPQAQICAAHIEQYHLVTLEAGRLLNQTGMFLVHHAVYPVAHALLQRALALDERLLGESHPVVASCLNNLGFISRAQGEYAEAEAFYQRALALREQQLGPVHAKTALSLNNLATCYQAQKKYTEAEPLYQRALAISEEQLGPADPETARCLANLAGIYRVQRRYVEAEPLFERALAIREQRSGAGHPDTAHSLANLALLYQDQQKYNEAEALFQRALAICKQQLEPDHPTTALYLNNLGTLYAHQQKYAEAEPLYQQALAIHERQSGPEHPQTILSLNDLADMLLALIALAEKRYTEAEPLLTQALSMYEQVLGQEHSTTLNTRKLLSDLVQAIEPGGGEPRGEDL